MNEKSNSMDKKLKAKSKHYKTSESYKHNVLLSHDNNAERQAESMINLHDEFISFFIGKGHVHKKESMIIPPEGDSTLLFTNSGMIQFKQKLKGVEVAKDKMVTTCQPCIRAGGKHNDIENVGATNRHHTMFEMLGNFSFNAYFKKEAIDLAWEFVTEKLKLNVDKIWITIYSSDDEAYSIWLGKVQEDRIVRLKENFWSSGSVGPCGYCSEIFYDRGELFKGNKPGDGDEGDRFVEIWNLVFVNLEQNESGDLIELKTSGVDTGMGLERMQAILEDKPSAYETSIFNKVIIQIEKSLGVEYSANTYSFRVIADHSRSIIFMISQGITPSSDKHGYVLRKLIRRGLIETYKASKLMNVFKDIYDESISFFKERYTDLEHKKNYVISILEQEFEMFKRTVDYGEGLIDKNFDSKVASKIYETHGVPFEISSLIAEKRYKKKISRGEFDEEYKKHVDKSEGTWREKAAGKRKIDFYGETDFKGYEFDSSISKVLFLEEIPLDEALDSPNEAGLVGLDKTSVILGGRLKNFNLNTDGVNNCQDINKDKRDVKVSLGGFDGENDRGSEFGFKTTGGFDGKILRRDPNTEKESASKKKQLQKAYNIVFDTTPFYATSGGQECDVGEIFAVEQGSLEDAHQDLKGKVKSNFNNDKNCEGQIKYNSNVNEKAHGSHESFCKTEEETCLYESFEKIHTSRLQNNVKIYNYKPVLIRKVGYIIKVEKQDKIFVHKVVTSESVDKNCEYFIINDSEKRNNTSKNHTAVHLLHYAIRKILGPNTLQKGSYVDDKKMRLDFNASVSLNKDIVDKIERCVNDQIFAGKGRKRYIDKPENALKNGVIGLFNEKYDDDAFVVEFGGSRELCGGTHVENTSEIGFFKVTSFSSIGSGIKRIEGITGFYAYKKAKEESELLQKLIEQTKTSSYKEASSQIKNIQDQLAEQKLKIIPFESSKFTLFFTYKLSSQDIKKLMGRAPTNKPSVSVNLTDNKYNVTIISGVKNQAKDIMKKYFSKGGGNEKMATTGGSLKNLLDLVNKGSKIESTNQVIDFLEKIF